MAQTLASKRKPRPGNPPGAPRRLCCLVCEPSTRCFKKPPIPMGAPLLCINPPDRKVEWTTRRIPGLSGSGFLGKSLATIRPEFLFVENPKTVSALAEFFGDDRPPNIILLTGEEGAMPLARL